MQKFDFKGYQLYSTDGYTHNTMAYFKNSSDAEKARGGDPYKGVSDAKMTVVVFDSYQEYVDYQQERMRETALAKLTPAERKLLGVD